MFNLYLSVQRLTLMSMTLYFSHLFFHVGISLAQLELNSPTDIFMRSHVFWIQNQTPITTKEEKLVSCGEFIALD